MDENGKQLRLERKKSFARWTFIIGKDGKILYKKTKVQPAHDSEQVLGFIEKLNKQSKSALQSRRAIRTQLAAMRLDWDAPPYPEGERDSAIAHTGHGCPGKLRKPGVQILYSAAPESACPACVCCRKHVW